MKGRRKNEERKGRKEKESDRRETGIERKKMRKGS